MTMTPESVKAAIHVIDARVTALGNQRPQLESALALAHSALRQAISDISVGAANADLCRESLRDLERAYTQALANLRGHVYSLEDVAYQMRGLAGRIVGEIPASPA